MSKNLSPEAPARRVVRFDRAERAAHWTTAAAVLVLVATGLILYIPSLSVAVGRRLLIEDIHVYVGIAVFVPLAISIAGPWGRRLRRDLLSMGRMRAGELAWLRSLGRRGRDELEKFNPGQKLNTYAVGGVLTVLLVTGLVLRWGNFIPVSWRTSATFVHDWFAIAIALLIFGHVLFAITHPASLRSMVTGTVTLRWIAGHAPKWMGGASAGRADESRPAARPLELTKQGSARR